MTFKNKRYQIINAYEEELKQLELKFDKELNLVLKARNEEISKLSSSQLYSDFWLRVLTNHKVINTMVNERDYEALKQLEDISYVKLDDGNVIIIIKRLELQTCIHI